MELIQLAKMKTRVGDGAVEYFLGENQELPMSQQLGKQISISFTGKISCTHCDRIIKKSFQNGYCYPCFQSLAETDRCIMSPELCHFAKGTCRDESFAKKHCFIPHVVYLADSSQIKVGITRSRQKSTRWIDQGATKAVAIWEVQNRKDAGDVEVFLKDYLSDKTNWRNMLKGLEAQEDLEFKRDEILEILYSADLPGEALDDEEILKIEFPVREYPTKVTSFNLDKDPEIKGVLKGIKAQYLILDSGVFNVRKHSGYEIELQIEETTI